MALNTRRFLVVAMLVACAGVVASARQSAVRVEVGAEDEPVEGARVTAGAVTITTDAEGRAQLTLPPGEFVIAVSKADFLDVSTTLTVVAGQDASIVVTLAECPRWKAK